MTNRQRLALVVVLLAPLACGRDVPDLNNPGLADLLNDPQPSEINSTATGLLVGSRAAIGNPNGYVAMLGILGREAYNFDAADPRFITEMLENETLDPGSPAFGGNFWNLPYRNVKGGLILLAALDVIPDADYPDKEAARGFAKTIMAYDYMRIISTRDENGAPIVTTLERTLDPIATKEQVLAHISMLLDEARTHLMAAAGGFAFPLSSGFAGFDEPDTFLEFNRALKARNEAYRGNHNEVLAALGESFISADAAAPSLGNGVFHVFGTGPGDALNGLISPNLFAHPSIEADAEEGDGRAERKLRVVPERTVRMLTSARGFTMYQSITASIPIIRNEELILLRAEANIGLGNLEAAEEDINFVRAHSAGLGPVDLTQANAIDQLLYERRYSLLFEGGHSWIDFRRFGRLDDLPLDREEHNIHAAFPIPTPETDARR